MSDVYPFNLDELSIKPTDYLEVEQNILGEGSFGKVYKTTYEKLPVAVRVLRTKGMTKEIREDIKKECILMEKLKCENVGKLITFTLDDKNACFVMELGELGSLYTILHDLEKFPQLVWSARVSIGLDIVRGMHCLHSQKPPIIHRDLKSLNIILRANWSAFLVDYGLSKAKTESVGTKLSGSFPWMAPEMYDNKTATTTAIDIYSFGMILYELLTRKIPFEGLNQLQICGAIMRGERPQLPENRSDIPKGYVELMEECWAQDPSKRPTTRDIIVRMEKILEIYQPQNRKLPLTPTTEKKRRPSRRAPTVPRDGLTSSPSSSFEMSLPAEALINSGIPKSPSSKRDSKECFYDLEKLQTEYEKSNLLLGELEKKDLTAWTELDKKKYEHAVTVIKKYKLVQLSPATPPRTPLTPSRPLTPVLLPLVSATPSPQLISRGVTVVPSPTVEKKEKDQQYEIWDGISSQQWPLPFPRGIISHPKIWQLTVCDYKTNYLRSYTPDGKEIKDQALLLSDPPMAITVDDKNNFYVVGRTHLTIFNLKKEKMGEWKLPSTEGYHRHVTIDSKANIIYLTIEYQNQIFLYTTEGKMIQKFGGIETKGSSKEGEFDEPQGLITDDSNIFICDSRNHRIQVLEKESGKYISQWGKKGTNNSQFEFPQSIYLSEEDDDEEEKLGSLVYIGDERSVQIFLKTGKFLQRIGDKETGCKRNQFHWVYDVCISFGVLYVCDAGNDRVQVFRKKGTSTTTNITTTSSSCCITSPVTPTRRRSWLWRGLKGSKNSDHDKGNTSNQNPRRSW